MGFAGSVADLQEDRVNGWGCGVQKWEYASFFWGGSSELTIRSLEFSHPNLKTGKTIGADEFWDAIRQLGEDGWEMVAVIDPPELPWQRYFFKRQMAA